MEELERKVDDIHKALLGDKYNPNGLIARVGTIEKKVEKHSVAYKVIIGIIVALATLFGIYSDLPK